VFGHSGSQAPQLMHSLVIIVAIGDPLRANRRAVCDACATRPSRTASGREPRNV